jgi:hypothetical protein
MTSKPLSKSCGDCTACCTIMGVASLNKPHYTSCKHICHQGCAIYKDKPTECSVWECAWKSGWIDGDERRRPDNLGVMFEFRLVGGSSFLWVYEVQHDAFSQSRVKYLLDRLGRAEILVLCRYGSMKISAEQPILDFLIEHDCGSKDVPIVPVCPVIDEEGHTGTLITERVGNKFVMKRT